MLSCSPAHAARRSDSEPIGIRLSSAPALRRNARIFCLVSLSRDSEGAAVPMITGSWRWRGREAVATHDLANLLDVGRPAAGEHGGDFLEVARTQQPGSNYREETRIDI